MLKPEKPREWPLHGQFMNQGTARRSDVGQASRLPVHGASRLVPGRAGCPSNRQAGCLPYMAWAVVVHALALWPLRGAEGAKQKIPTPASAKAMAGGPALSFKERVKNFAPFAFFRGPNPVQLRTIQRDLT